MGFASINPTVRQLRRDSLVASDGPAGWVRDVYFDDARWKVRYVVVHTGGWLAGRDVLIAPETIDPRAWSTGILRARLTREEVEHAPDVESEWPVDRQLKLAHAMRLGYPYYWSAPALWGAVGVGRTPEEAERTARALLHRSNPHLESAAALMGWRIEARDAELGSLEDLVVDEHHWAIAGLVVRSRAPRRGVTSLRVVPALVERLDWSAHKLYLQVKEGNLPSL